jgi:hypothetical protein
MPRLSPAARCALTAPFHPCLCRRTDHRRCAFCCTFRRLATPGRYPAPCPAELGLSSTRSPVPRSSLASRNLDFQSDTPCPECHATRSFSPTRTSTTAGDRTVPRRGLEPPRRFRHQILSLACLPISAPGQLSADAPERTRTSTGLRPLDPESSASTSSATGAQTIRGARGVEPPRAARCARRDSNSRPSDP